MDKCRRSLGWPLTCLILTGLLFTQPALADYTLNMTRGVTEVSQEIYRLHMIIFWICVAIGIVVFSLMIYALIWHRKSANHTAAHFHESTIIEVIWSIIPFAILIAMAIPATRVLVLMDDTSQSDLTIKAIGHRWFWQYDYLDYDVNFFSYLSTPEDEISNFMPKNPNYLLEVDEPLVVPIGKKIRILTTASDVIHAWWVPALGLKKDAIPGFINEIWTVIDEPGTYRGQCAELCGAKHGYMPIVVEAKSEVEFDDWIAKKQNKQQAAMSDGDKEWSMEELMAKGEKEYNTVCAMCHQSNGKGMPPTFPSLDGSPICNSTDRLAEHIDIVLHGRNAMPGQAALKNDFELAAVITYERNAWGNKTGDIVQPKDIRAARNKN